MTADACRCQPGPVRRGRGIRQVWWYDTAACRNAGWTDTRDDPCRTLARLVDLADTPVGTVLKSDDRSVVTRVDAAGGSWIVKRYRMSAPKTLLYHAVRLTPAWREWRGARLIASLGRRVAVPLAMGLHRRGVVWDQVLIFPWVEGRTLHEMLVTWGPADQWSDADRTDRLTLARQVGDQIGALTAAGVVNRDHKPANLIIDERCLRGDEPILIDLVGLRRRNRSQVRRMLETLLRSAVRVAPVTARERAACLHAARLVDPTIREGTR